MSWHGPYQIRELLDKAIDDNRDFPSEDAGIYVVTQKSWQTAPGPESVVLYVGGNTGRSKRFRTRIGDLVADMHGFFGEETGHHSGGQSIWKWCCRNSVRPSELYLAWQTEIECKRCAEIEAYDNLHPELNKNRPSRCPEHG